MIWLGLFRWQWYAGLGSTVVATGLLGYIFASNLKVHADSVLFASITTLFAVIMTVAHLEAIHANARGLDRIFRLLWQHIDAPEDRGAKLEDYIRGQFSSQEAMRLLVRLQDINAKMQRIFETEEKSVRVQCWYQAALSHLQATVHQHVDGNSLLLKTLAEYAWLFPSESERHVNASVVFDLFAVVDKALASARQIQPPADKVHLAVSLHPNTPKLWIGRPQELEILVRQMLLIALHRTRCGMISMRLKTLPCTGCKDQAFLVIHMQDSGAYMQPGKVQQWLAGKDSGNTHDANPKAVPWRIMVNVAAALQSTLRAESSGAGLMLEGMVPLEITPETPIPVGAWEHASALSPPKRLKAPLVLVVEDNVRERQRVSSLFAQAGCRTFMVNTHEQALQWACVLPFSAIVLNATLPDARDYLPRRLHAMIEEGLMPDVPFWAMLSQEPFICFDHWQKAGVSELLIKPLRLDGLQPLCKRLTLQDADFYRARDARISHELPIKVKQKMQQMHEEINQQLVPVEVIARKLARGQRERVGAGEAHAVKSAALSLGYFRLAGCMGKIESAIANPDIPPQPENWAVIAECLQAARF
jgi:CheY-like chemotaxis protein